MTILNNQTPAQAVPIQTASIEVEALELNAAAQALRPTVVGVWDLQPTTKEAPEEKDVRFLSHKNPGEESVLEGDDRVPVKPEDILPGGKYRSIIKLLMKYERLPGKFAHGTGWLIRPDLMVTAGHNVHDWKYNGGRAVEIKAYAGYNGKASITDPKCQVEFRTGKRCVTTERWLTSRGAKAFDVAFVQLDKPFTDVTPIRYIETPPLGSLSLGVVGYPADIKDSNDEKGARMYEMFLDTNYNLATQADTMLAYCIDTEGGNSGAPVLRGSDLVAIGAHVYGGDINTASIIGRYGNSYEDHIAAMRLELPRPGLNMVSVAADRILGSDGPTGPVAKNLNDLDAASVGILPVGATGVVNGKKVTNEGQTGSTIDTNKQKPEGFFNFIGDVLSVTQKAAPFLGPVGGPIVNLIGPIIAENLRLAQQMAEGSFEDLDVSAISRRAQIADAALVSRYQRAAKSAKTSKTSEEGFFDDAFQILFPVQSLIINEVRKAVAAGASESIFDDVLGAIKGAPMPFLPFGLAPAVLDVLKIPVQSYENAVNDVAKLLMKGAMLSRAGSAESALDGHPTTNGTPTNNSNEAKFASELAEKVRSSKSSSSQEEGWFDDFTKPFSDIGNAIGGAVQDAGRAVEGVANDAGKALEGVAKDTLSTVRDGVNIVNKGINDAADTVSRGGLPGRVLGSVIRENVAVDMLKMYGDALNRVNLQESALDAKSENIFEDAEAAILTVARAFVLRTVLADELLTATMQRPTQELKEEGFFDDVLDVVDGFAKGFTQNSPGAILGRDLQWATGRG